MDLNPFIFFYLFLFISHVNTVIEAIESITK